MEYQINGIEQIPAVAKEIIDQLQYKLICFEGEMGAGKTTFIKEFVHLLGTDDDISSPTFLLLMNMTLKKEKFFISIFTD